VVCEVFMIGFGVEVGLEEVCFYCFLKVGLRFLRKVCMFLI